MGEGSGALPVLLIGGAALGLYYAYTRCLLPFAQPADCAGGSEQQVHCAIAGEPCTQPTDCCHGTVCYGGSCAPDLTGRKAAMTYAAPETSSIPNRHVMQRFVLPSPGYVGTLHIEFPYEAPGCLPLFWRGIGIEVWVEDVSGNQIKLEDRMHDCGNSPTCGDLGHPGKLDVIVDMPIRAIHFGAILYQSPDPSGFIDILGTAIRCPLHGRVEFWFM